MSEIKDRSVCVGHEKGEVLDPFYTALKLGQLSAYLNVGNSGEKLKGSEPQADSHSRWKTVGVQLSSVCGTR